MQRQEFISELDSKHVDGVPDHDFTAGNMAGQGAYEDYHQDPYASAEAYEYDAAYQYHDDVTQHHDAGYDQPTQDTGAGYTDLHRGNSIGSGSGHGHGPVQPQYPVEQFPMPDHYLGRPTGGADGPYVVPCVWNSQKADRADTPRHLTDTRPLNTLYNSPVESCV